MSPTASAGLAADLARAYQSHGPRPQGSGASSASRRGGASSAQQSRGRSPLGKTLHPAAGLCVCPQCLAGPHSPVRHPMDMCKRRDLQWHAPSPYLEDLAVVGMIALRGDADMPADLPRWPVETAKLLARSGKMASA